MSTINVSVIVTEQSRILENNLLQVDVPLFKDDADEFHENLKKWLGEIPEPGVVKVETPIDQATLLAVELPHILHGRDPELFGRYYVDKEGDTALVEHRPYDWAQLEVV